MPKNIRLGFIFLVMIFAFLGSGIQSWAENIDNVSGTVKITGNTVNVRSGPAINEEKIGSVLLDSQWPCLSAETGWYQIHLDSGMEGWVSADYAQLIPEKKTGTVVITGSKVNVRQAPGIDEEKIGFVNQDDQLVCLAEVAGWYQILLPSGEKGWVVSEYAYLVVETTPEPEEAIKIKINNEIIAVDTAPYIDANGRVVVPVRFIADFLGAQTDWIPAEHKVMISAANLDLALFIGQKKALLNEEELALDTNPVIKNDRTMLPLRFVGESFGAQVDWLQNEHIVSIQMDRQAAEEEISQNENSGARQIGTILGQVVNIRSGPDKKYSVIYQALAGDFFPILDQAEEWYQVEVEPGFTGWVHGSLIYLEYNDFGTGENEQNQDLSLQGKVIVIDPGHGCYKDSGRYDPGAVGQNGTYEADVVLAIGEKTRAYLQEMGATVIMTRNCESVVSLVERAEIANENEADIFVSIHADANLDRNRQGSTVYYFADDSEDFIAQYKYRKKLAEFVQASLVSKAETIDLGIRNEDFVVIRETEMPSVLVETAHISNLKEEELLQQDDFQAKVAQGIAEGIKNYCLY